MTLALEPTDPLPPFLAGGGEMGALIRAYDWRATSLGDPRRWPVPLRTVLRVLLTTNHPIFVFWGAQHICFYNDAYAQSLGPEKHPSMLGAPGRAVWNEIWEAIGPQIDQVMTGRGATWHEDHFLPIIRNGRLEDVYWTYSYGPIDDEAAPSGVGGVLVICTETTAKVFAEQRLTATIERQQRLFNRAPGFIAIVSGPQHVFEFANDAYARLVGKRDSVGKTVRDALPDLEGQGFFELLDTVYATGKPFIANNVSIRLQRSPGIATEERFVDFIYQPVTDEADRVTGIFVEGHDVTDAHFAQEALRVTERRQAFRIALDDALRDLSAPDEVMAIAAELLGRHLCAGRCGYGEVDETGEFAIIERDWTDGTMPSAAGRHRMDDFCAEFTAEYRAGRAIRLDDAQADSRVGADAVTALALGGTRATLTMPLVKDGRFVAALYVHQAAPRHWTDEDEAIVREVGERTWAAVGRARAEAALRESEAHLSSALAIARLGTFEWNLLTNVVMLDDRSSEIFNFAPGERMRAPEIFDRIEPSDLERIVSEVRASQRALSRLETEYRLILPDGTIRTVVSISDAVPGSDGKAERMFGVFGDITMQKQTEAALRELNADLERRVIERTRELSRTWQVSPDLLGVLNRAGYLESSNPAWKTLLGWSEEDFRQTRVFDLIHPDDLDQSYAAFEQIKRGEPVLGFENRYRDKTGGWHWLSWVAVPENEKFYCSARDITEEKAREAELKTVEGQLRQAQKMEAVGQLTGGIAHDFNNMLMGILGALEIVQRRIATGRYDDVDRFIDAARHSGERAAELTRRLLAFSRSQSLKLEALDANLLARGMEELLRRTLGKSVGLTLVLQADAWPVEADASQLENALLNLALNARDAMPDGGVLTIETTNASFSERDSTRPPDLVPGDYISLSVADTGSGMPRSVIERAFDPFFTTKPIGQGTGLGLSMIYGFAKQSRGHVAIDSEVGRGTKVTLFLPRASADVVAEADRIAPKPDLARAGETVMVVDDDETVRLLITEVLTELGYDNVQAAHGNAALPILRSGQRIDLLVTDVGLPGMNGRQLAEIARQVRPGLKVLFVTGYAETAAVHGGFLDEGTDLISKPFALDALGEKVRSMLSTA